jgi:hypothetical protein
MQFDHLKRREFITMLGGADLDGVNLLPLIWF